MHLQTYYSPTHVTANPVTSIARRYLKSRPGLNLSAHKRPSFPFCNSPLAFSFHLCSLVHSAWLGIWQGGLRAHTVLGQCRGDAEAISMKTMRLNYSLLSVGLQRHGIARSPVRYLFFRGLSDFHGFFIQQTRIIAVHQMHELGFYVLQISSKKENKHINVLSPDFFAVLLGTGCIDT